jgi:hypothetical protein
VNYDNFVTAYSYPVDLFGGGDELPRLESIPIKFTSQMREDIRDLVMNHDVSEAPIEWQAVTDMIVGRYASRLKQLASRALPTGELLRKELYRTMQPFIDYDLRNTPLEVERCATQFLPPPSTQDSRASTSLAARVTGHISHKVCQTLLLAAEEDYETAIARIRDLNEYLNWTTWKECQGCEYDEICFIPIWPYGSIEDHRQPNCKKEIPLHVRHRYWDEFWGLNH